MPIRRTALAALALQIPSAASAEEVGLYNFVVEISGITASAPDARGFVSEHDARECMGAESVQVISDDDGSELVLTGLELWSDELLWAWLDAIEGDGDIAEANLLALDEDGKETARMALDLTAMAILVEVPKHGLVPFLAGVDVRIPN